MATKEALTENAQAKFNSIRSNDELTNDAKLRHIAAVYVEAKQALNIAEAEEKAATEARKEGLARKIYGIPNQADPGSMISYRDAVDRANQIGPLDETAGAAMLTSARTTGDDYLVRAVLRTAFERRWDAVINKWLELEPARDADATELWNLTERAGFSLRTLLSTPYFKPSELSHLGEYEIANLAKG